MLELKRPLAIFDLEATGIDIAVDRIVQISILKIMPNGDKIWYNETINPTIPIPKKTSLIHGLYDEDVANAPTFAEVAKNLYDFLKNCDLGGYNSNRFDIPMLNEEFLRLEMDIETDKRKFVDVFRIFQKMEGRDLASAYKFYCQKELLNAHDAKVDVKATYEVLMGQLARYGNDLAGNIDFLDEFSNDNNFVDYGRRLVLEEGVVKFNFGKHKGKSVEEVLRKEPQYYDWIMRNNFLRDTKQKLSAIRLAMKFKMK
jgi:DNA polymerase-3 subunit epsilon